MSMSRIYHSDFDDQMGYFEAHKRFGPNEPSESDLESKRSAPIVLSSPPPYCSAMPGLSCNACNTEFADDTEQRLHFKSEWHRYNLKRKVAGVPGVIEALFLVRQSAFDQEKNKANEAPMLYSCGLCGKGYRSSQAHAQHLNSRAHITRTSQGLNPQDEETAIVRPLPPRRIQQNKPSPERESDEESEWEEADDEENLVGDTTKSTSEMNVDEIASDEDMNCDDDDDVFELDPSCCFMCDKQHKTIDRCMVHMHKHHGFYIPDVEYLKDPKGLLTYLGLKVKRDYLCLYCTDRCHPFTSLEAVRKHMEAKRHCRVHYGDDDEEEEADLEDFYDYSSSYVTEDGKQLVAAGDMGNSVEFGTGGSDLIITRTSKDKTSTRKLGSREYLRYYRQKPRPSPNSLAVTAVLASRYKSMGLATVQSRDQIVRMKVLKQRNRSGVDAMRSKLGMKSNVIRNLPHNCTY